MNERQRDTVKKAIKAFADKGGLRAGPDTSCLMAQFGMVDE
jgi:hypothetical protein